MISAISILLITGAILHVCLGNFLSVDLEHKCCYPMYNAALSKEPGYTFIHTSMHMYHKVYTTGNQDSNKY